MKKPSQTADRAYGRRLALSVGLFVTGLLAIAGCQHGSDAKHTAVPVSLDSPRRPAPKEVKLIQSPREVHEDYGYPASATQQSFYWQNLEAEWRIKLPHQGYGHAGFRFHKSYNFLPHRDSYEIIFTITPALMSRYLWIGLVDGDDQPASVMVDRPLSDYRIKKRLAGASQIRIPLRDFPSEGVIVSRAETAELQNLQPFDWQDVREIRFFHTGGRMPAREIVITDLRITRESGFFQ